MKILIAENYSQMSKLASQIIIKDINKKPNLVLGLATGKTQLGLYKELIKENKKGKVDFSKVKTFNLDEYYPMSKKSKKSYFYYMNRNFFDKINIKKENVNLLNGETKNWKKECANYERKIKKSGGIDLQILGVGTNGHIGFNEPGSLKNSKTRLVNLSKQTRKTNKIKIKKALTIGISTILKSKKVILLASGKNKKNAIRHLVYGKETKNYPVSYLKKHKNLILIADKECLEI